MISRKILDDAGIDIPEEASRFFTQGSAIVFLVPFADEYGSSIVFTEQEIEMTLTEKQVEALKSANCYGETGWTLL